MDYKKLKGNLGLKSSALAPTACKLSSQFLVLDHMSNHYMKIARAKSAIDSRPPKSLATSQKMRDRMSRDRSGRSPLPRSHSAMSGVNVYEYEDVLKDEPEDEEERLVHSIMRQTLLDKSKSGNIPMYSSASNLTLYDKDTYGSQQMQQMTHSTHYAVPYGTMTYDHPTSVRSVRSGHSLNISASRQVIPTNVMANRLCNGDVLEKRPHLFTEPEIPFTPRTLKKQNTESRLKHSKCYNPPRVKNSLHASNANEKSTMDTQTSSKKETTNTQNNNEKDTTKIHQKQQSPPKTNKRKKVKDVSKTEHQQTSPLTDSMLMGVTVHSQDETQGQNVKYNVPPLAITMDKDHMNWLKEQASKAEIRLRSSARLKSSLHSDEELHPRNKGSAIETNAKKEKQKKDEEQKYLAFAKEVTDDVLSRGISSDSVLYRVFENHIERRKADLDEGRMRKVITDLRKNLGLTNSPAKGRTLASLSDSNYNNKLGKDNAAVRNSSSISSSLRQNSSSKSASDKDKPLDMSQTNVLSEMGTSMESESTLQFAQTGDMLSTIHSEASLEASGRETKLDRLDGTSELTDTQTWKQYELSLTAKEHGNNHSSSSAIDDEHAASKSEKDKVAVGQERHAVGERRLTDAEMFQSDTFSNEEGKGQLTRGSHNGGSVEASADGEMIYSGTSRPITDDENHKRTSEDISSSSNTDHAIENVSVGSHSSTQRPTVKPRTRVRLGSQEVSQDKADAVTPVIIDESHEATGVKHSSMNGLAKEEPHTDTVMQNHKTSEDAPEGNKPGNDPHNHQQPTEENYEYEDDYEEVIDSEEDSHADSADDF